MKRFVIAAVAVLGMLAIPAAANAFTLPVAVKKGHHLDARIAAQQACQEGASSGYDGNNLWTIENYFNFAGNPPCYAHQKQGLGEDLYLNGNLVQGSYHTTNCADDTAACVNSENLTLPPNTVYSWVVWDQTTADSGYSFSSPLPAGCTWNHQPTQATCTATANETF